MSHTCTLGPSQPSSAPADFLAAGVGTLESIISSAELGPVFVRRGPYEYPCELTISDAGAEASFPGTDEFLPMVEEVRVG